MEALYVQELEKSKLVREGRGGWRQEEAQGCGEGGERERERRWLVVGRLWIVSGRGGGGTQCKLYL